MTVINEVGGLVGGVRDH